MHLDTDFSQGFRQSYLLFLVFMILTFWVFLKNQSEGFERIIQVPGCDDGTGLGHDKNLVSVVVVVVVARLGAVVSI